MAGKTGTAETAPDENPGEDHSLFVGFGPAADGVEARYSAAVIMEHSGGGGAAAAPAVRRIFEPIATNGLDAVDLQALVDPNTVQLPPPPATTRPTASHRHVHRRSAATDGHLHLPAAAAAVRAPHGAPAHGQLPPATRPRRSATSTSCWWPASPRSPCSGR